MVASIINVALPAIQETLGATVAEMQWVASAYTVLLAALTLAGGAAGDRFGRRRAFQAGTAGLGAASIAASLAPDVGSLIAARAAQGLAAALLVPNSLALLSAAFPRAERGRAIGTWSAATALIGAVSPLVGGWFVDAGSWRVAFAAVVPPVLVTLAIGARRVPDPSGDAPRARRRLGGRRAGDARAPRRRRWDHRLRPRRGAGGRARRRRRVAARVRPSRAPRREPDAASGALRLGRVRRREPADPPRVRGHLGRLLPPPLQPRPGAGLLGHRHGRRVHPLRPPRGGALAPRR